jgi:hypothetical protein
MSKVIEHIKYIFQLALKLITRTKKKQLSGIAGIKDGTSVDMVYVTIDWAGNPITTKGDGYILPRKAEMILNKKYYKNGIIGEWPCDHISGEKLPIEPKI